VIDPRVLAGLRVQLESWRAELDAGAGRIGWKIGLNTPAAQRHLGIPGPVIGHLTSATLIELGSSCSIGGGPAVMVEPEIAIEVGVGSVIGVGAAIELIQPDRELDDVERIVAGNVFHRAVVLGPSRPGDDLPQSEAVVTVNGEERGRAPADADVAGTVRLTAELLAEVGERLLPGERIIAGALTPPVPVEPGDRVTVDLGPLGRLQTSFHE
jgi:2-keto-4-pentenoate hydratase